MTIHIDNLHFDTIIGLLDFERERTQKVSVDLKLDYDYAPDVFIDYSDLCELIEQQVRETRYKLLEEALLDLETRIRSRYPRIRTLYLKISKPDIISNATVGLSQEWHY
jgi:dihydroneopterin aldolase